VLVKGGHDGGGGGGDDRRGGEVVSEACVLNLANFAKIDDSRREKVEKLAVWVCSCFVFATTMDYSIRIRIPDFFRLFRDYVHTAHRHPIDRWGQYEVANIFVRETAKTTRAFRPPACLLSHVLLSNDLKELQENAQVFIGSSTVVSIHLEENQKKYRYLPEENGSSSRTLLPYKRIDQFGNCVRMSLRVRVVELSQSYFLTEALYCAIEN
jgi:hypothetical protein